MAVSYFDKVEWAASKAVEHKLTQMEERVLIFVARRVGDDNEFYWSLARTAKECGTTRRTVGKAMETLARLKLVSRRQRKRGRENDTTLVRLLCPAGPKGVGSGGTTGVVLADHQKQNLKLGLREGSGIPTLGDDLPMEDYDESWK